MDATILAQRPKLAPHLEQMRENLAARMKVEPEQVNVKATTEAVSYTHLARRRVVGSISRVTRAERAAAAEKVWAEIEDGKRYTGTVKSLTSYGAFVDIGGVDGMVHISELSRSCLLYTSANALLGAIWQPVTRVFHVKDGWARVEVDFERTEPALYGRVSLSLTVGELAALGLSFGVKALSVLLAVRREDRRRAGQKQKAAV